MRKPHFARLVVLAFAAYLAMVQVATAQEVFLSSLESYLGGPPANAAQEGCQGNCGWISDGCAGDDCCFPATTARLEYLLWFGRGQNIPALVTTSPAGTPRPEAGVLGFPNTTVLFGDEGIQQNLRSGLRLTVNHAVNDCGDMVGARIWGLENANTSFFRTSTGDPILARPFFNTQLPGEDSQLIAFPGVVTDGSVNIRASNEILGADAWFRRTLSRDACFQMDWLAGYQFVRINDSLFINNTQTDIQNIGIPDGTVIAVQDAFRAHNEFHGGTLGLVAENRSGCYQLDLLAKVAIGNMHQTVLVNGSTTVIESGLAPFTSPGGLLAQGTNSGIRSRNRLAFIPEINVNLGYRVNDQLSLTMGYSFLYFSDVAVAGGQIDQTVNLSQNPGPIVGPVRPAPLFNTTDYWVQGLSLGLDYHF